VAVSFDAGAAASADNALSLDVNLTIAANSDRVLLASVHVFDGSSVPSVSTVAWDPTGVNEALTQVRDTGIVETFSRLAVWRRFSPTAKAALVRVTLSATADELTISAESFYDANTATLGADDQAIDLGADEAHAITLASETGAMVFACCCGVNNSATGPTVTPGAGQTNIWQEEGLASNFMCSSGDRQAGAASVTFDWTYSATNLHKTGIAVSVKPAGAPPAGGPKNLALTGVGV
jgi:hypothetical protein